MMSSLKACTDEGLDLGQFDRVLVDAPCTGLGTIRRHPEIAWRRRADDIPRLAEIQARLLATGARHLAPGGRMVYAVCTFTADEGPPEELPGLTREATLNTRPSEGLDAFQAAVWRRPPAQG